MMGRKARIFRPIESITLDALVPADHFYRHVERSLNLSFVRDLVAGCYAVGGRPSIDPVVFFKLQLVMFFEGIRSERQLMDLAADRLSVRWYLGYDLHEPLPDHSSLTRIRDRYGLAIFRRFFETIVEHCQRAGLVWGQELYIDATQVKANASLDSLAPRFAVEAHLASLFNPEADRASQPHMAPAPIAPLESTSTATAELAEENASRHDWLARMGRPDRRVQRGGYQRRSNFEASWTDPDASLMFHKSAGLRVGYHDHLVVDGGKARVILAALVTPAEVMENQPALDLLWHTCFRWRLRPRQVTGDTTYATGENIRALEGAGIHAYLPLADWDRTVFYGPSRFTYETEHDRYRCPEGHTLRRYSYRAADEAVAYRADGATCNACPVKAACTTSNRGRMIHRSVYTEDFDRVRAYHDTPAYAKAMSKRKVWVEPLFGEAKQWHGLEQFRLRGLVKVNGEALLIAAGQNLKRLLSWRGWGRRPWPSGAAGVRLSRQLDSPMPARS
ncbi:MAG: IS1182 family transposase [Chloroflexota bacterium]|nr:IS1182 family transposase [Chloroflexota bacterium]